MRSVIGAILLTAALAGRAAAQTAAADRPGPVRFLTFAQALARARTAGFEVRIAQADAAIAEADAASSRAPLRPQLGLSVNALDANQPQLGMPVARQAYGAVLLAVPLSTPASKLAARAAAVTALAAAGAASAAANDAAFATARAYRRLQLAEAVLTARSASVTSLADHLRVTKLRVAAGKSARFMLARDRAALANAQQAQEDAASERDQAGNDLAALLDLAAGTVAVEPLERSPFADTRDAVLGRALRQRPGLLAAEQRVQAAEAAAASARAAYRPSAALTAQSYNGASSPALGWSGSQVELTASLPLVDGGSRAAAAAKARAEFARAVATREQSRAGVAREVANAWREYEAATRNIVTAAAAAADAHEQLRVATLRESAGKAITGEVLDAFALSAAASETVARGIARYDIAVAALHHAAGDLTP